MKLVRIVGLTTALSISAAQAAPQLDQENVAPEFAATGVGSDFVAQVITAGASGVLTSLDFSIRKLSSTLGDVTLEIRGVIYGEPNSTILGTKDFANASISPVSDEFTTFDLQSLNLTFNIGDSFAVVFTSTNNNGSPFPIALSENNAYSGGALYSSVDGTNWVQFGGGSDARFRTFVNDPVQVVGIDIKPGSDPNCFNINGHGVIPVAILGSDTFDVTDVDTSSLSFGGLAVRIRGKKGPLCHVEYIDNDMFLDLVCQFEDDPENWSVGDEEATLLGDLLSGGTFAGADSICVVP